MLLSHLNREEKRPHIRQINALTLGELINQLRINGEKVYQEITNPDELLYSGSFTPSNHKSIKCINIESN